MGGVGINRSSGPEGLPVGREVVDESELRDISEMSEEELAKLTRNEGPKLVYFDYGKKDSRTLKLKAPRGSVGYEIGETDEGNADQRRCYAAAVQYYKPKNL